MLNNQFYEKLKLIRFENCIDVIGSNNQISEQLKLKKFEYYIEVIDSNL